MVIRVVIPSNPVAKGRPRLGKGHVFTPQKTRDYESLVKSYAYMAMENEKMFLKETPLKATIICYVERKNKRPYPVTRPDLDNYIKAVLDGFNGIVFEDDSSVICIEAYKLYGETPRVEVKIEPIDEFLTPSIF